jgi:hypothetical protein
MGAAWSKQRRNFCLQRNNPTQFKVSRYSGKDEVMPEEKSAKLEQISFVNGAPADCGCVMKFSSGHGEYSDVHELTFCPAHGSKPFGPAEVLRDKDGWWWHPGIPGFGDGEDPAPYNAWAKDQGLEFKGWHSGDETYDLPEEDAACTAWNPESPGPEWFLMGIFDSEDGPYVQWARRLPI